jgi:hypothetical protein
VRLHHEESLRDDLIAARQVSMFREQFADALGAAGWPEGACVFLIMPASSSSLVTLQLEECATITNSEEADAVFFSPAGIAVVPHLIAICGAEANPPPDRACATLFLGTTNDWDLLPCQTH